MESKGLEYRLINQNKQYRVVGLGDNKDENLYIPEEHEGIVVSEVGFRDGDFDHVKSIHFPKSIASIDELSMFKNLEAIEVDEENESYFAEEDVLYDGRRDSKHRCLVRYAPKKPQSHFVCPSGIYFTEGAFAEATNLKSIELPEDLTTVEDCLFSNCSSLERIDIPSRVSEIMRSAFSGCTSLKEVVFQEDYIGEMELVVLESCAFSGCAALTSIEIPSSVKMFSNDAFYKSGLQEIKGNFSGNRSKDGVLYSYSFFGLDHITLYPPCRQAPNGIFVIPDSIKRISADCFSSNKSLVGIVLPKELNWIGKDAFFSAENLQALYYLGNEEEWSKVSLEGKPTEDISILFYSETKPVENASAYWRYVEGVPKAWE